MATSQRIAEALDARLVVFVEWRGGELNRLLDADHAALQEKWAVYKRRVAQSWASRQEVTYNHFGDRGSIDDLAFDAVTGTLLVSELKTGIYDVQRMLAKMDEKERLASDVARRFEWDVRRVVGCLVLADTRTNRRRVQQHAGLFGRFDVRGRTASAWLNGPWARVRAPSLPAVVRFASDAR